MIEIRHQIWQILEVGYSNLKSNAAATEIEELDDQGLLVLSYPRPLIFVVVLLNLVQEELLGLVVVGSQVVGHKAVLVDLLDTFDEGTLQAKYAILDAFDQLFALNIEIQSYLRRIEKRIAMAASLEPQMNERLNHILIDDPELSILLHLLFEGLVVHFAVRHYDGVVLQVELEAHHVFCVLDVQNLQDLLANGKLVELSDVYHHVLVGVVRLAAASSHGLAELAPGLALLAQLAAYLTHEVEVVVSLVANLADVLAVIDVQIEGQLNGLSQIRSLIIEIEVLQSWLAALQIV